MAMPEEKTGALLIPFRFSADVGEEYGEPTLGA